MKEKKLNGKKILETIAKVGFSFFAAVLLVTAFGKADVEAATKAQYYTKTYNYSKTYKGTCTIKDVEKYERIILKGNSDAVKKINSTLKKAWKGTVKHMPAGYAKNDCNYGTTDMTYINKFTSRVTYNKNNVISIVISNQWFQGGVADYGMDCYTFSLKTGKLLKLKDVCGSSNAKLTKEIKSKLVKKYGKSVFYPSSLDEISASDVNFYLKPGKKAIVHFNKYEISYGAAGDFAVKLTSKYK